MYFFGKVEHADESLERLLALMVVIAESDANQTDPAISAGEQPTDPVVITWQEDRQGKPVVYQAASTDAFLHTNVSVVSDDVTGDSTAGSK